jgi:hypothetical protein
MDRDEIINLDREPSIDASYRVSIHLATRFRGEDFLEINPNALTNMVGTGNSCF